MSQSRLSNC